jgi:signal transduction histidine kinase
VRWIFVSRNVFDNQRNGQGGPPQPGQQPNNNNNTLRYVLASPEPNQTLGTIFDSFGETFLLPVCQAGLLGLVIALALSAWIARSVAKPLRAIAEATGRVASGDYEHRVPVTGPTEARVVGHAFNNMTAQVKFTQQAQQDFLANVSHDLRTPLTSIQGYSQAIIDGIASNPETAKHAATIINEEAGRLNRMVNDLLDIAKIQAGRMQMMRQAVEVDQVLRLVGGSMAVKAEQKGVQLHTQIPDLTRIAGDGDRLAQVFTNLVDNAVKHTDSGGQVWFNASLEDGGVLVMVQDTGEGIPTEDLSRIFERFYQVDKSRNRPSQRDGAGLGLAITHEIVHAHGGRIWVESEVGTGTRFSVWLPMMSGDRSTVIRMRL